MQKNITCSLKRKIVEIKLSWYFQNYINAKIPILGFNISAYSSWIKNYFFCSFYEYVEVHVYNDEAMIGPEVIEAYLMAILMESNIISSENL